MISAFVSVWTELMTFMTSIFADITTLFYAEGSLTFIGTLAVIMAGISIVLLVWNLIRSFFPMRG